MTAVDPEELKVLEEKAESGDPRAQAGLGDFYISEGNDPEKAFRLYSESAGKGNPNGLYGLASCLYDGIGTEMDRKEAISVYRKASINGSKDADRVLIDLIVEGELGTIPDPECFKENFERAQHGDAESMNLVGMCYQYGMGTKKSVVKAIYWYQEAALYGSLEGSLNLNSICCLTGCTRDDLEEIGHNSRFRKE